jgi:hypothetical protein
VMTDGMFFELCEAYASAGQKPRDVRDVSALVKHFYEKPGNGAGGSLHIVLDDGNIEDDSIAFCRKWAADRDDRMGVALCDVLILCSQTQRRKL